MLRVTAVPEAVTRRPSPLGVQDKPRARANPQPGGNEPLLPIAVGDADVFEREARGVARAVPDEEGGPPKALLTQVAHELEGGVR